MKLRDAGLFSAGLGFLALAKAKNLLRGYSSPKTFDMSQTDRCVAYDMKVVREWLREFERYAGAEASVRGMNVLELGPGSDLGVGLILLANGARRYNACDVNDLVKHAPPAFYEALFAELGRTSDADIASLRAALERTRAGAADSALNYVVRNDFDIAAAFGPKSIDLVFSQAAFEHFDDIDAVVRRLSVVCKSGARIVAEIDLKTHSRWIRDKDPNNIYRYPAALYKMFAFRGIPNRVRPYQYCQAFQRHGWVDIDVRPLEQLPSEHGRSDGLSAPFRNGQSEMQYLSVVFCARKA